MALFCEWEGFLFFSLFCVSERERETLARHLLALVLRENRSVWKIYRWECVKGGKSLPFILSGGVKDERRLVFYGAK